MNPGKNREIKIENKLKQFREEISVSQSKMARDLEITRQTIIAIEKNKYLPTLKLAFIVSEYLGKTIDEVFQLEYMD